MLFQTEDELLQRVHYWIERWADRQRKCRAEIMSELFYPPSTSVGELSPSNFAVSEDDAAAYYEKHEARSVEMVDAIMSDLRAEVPWAAWAICRRHQLGNMGMNQYERLARGGMIPPGLYTSALEEVTPLMAKRGLL